MYQNWLDDYKKHTKEREETGIPSLPLNSEQTYKLCETLKIPLRDDEKFLLDLFENRINPGVDEAAKIKAEFCDKIIKGEVKVPFISPEKAIEILGTMIGGYNVKALVNLLEDERYAENTVNELKNITLIDNFDRIANLSETNVFAKKLIDSWANAEWFLNKNDFPKQIKVKVFKVDGEINTDDFSPAGQAFTRSDIPLHASAMGRSRFPDGVKTIAKWRKDGFFVAFAGDVVGTGSSRKSAVNSLLWHIGNDIDFVPNKRRGGVVLGGVVAPIFFNTLQDSGGLAIICDVSKLQNGDEITIDTQCCQITKNGDSVCKFQLKPAAIKDEFRTGGRINLIIGKSLTEKARNFLGLPKIENVFTEIPKIEHEKQQRYTLAQKIVGKACNTTGVLPFENAEPKMTTVGSQDTTGPMTADELTELACLKFQAPLFMQSFCHTNAYPKAGDITTHKRLPKFVEERGGIALRPGDGVIHSWLNRLLIPDTVGTGGDSHTRFPVGISFPAGSGLVAFAAAQGFMPLDMPESVLVKFGGTPNKGITIRDVVNSIPYFAIKKGLLSVPKKNKINVFNGRILEMEGLENISVEQAFELTDASAERSAAACTIALSKDSVKAFLEDNIKIMRDLISDGYQSKEALQNRIDSVKKWLENPVLLRRDENAVFAETLQIDLSEITEPIVACPNDPDDVKLLSEISGVKIDDVFIGSCMTSVEHFRNAAKIWKNAPIMRNTTRTFIAPPTRIYQNQLKNEAAFAVFNQIGATIEPAGCSLCMGNQLRVGDGDIVFSTSTRNFDDRMGKDAKVYLGSAELAAIISKTGKIPSVEEYFKETAEI
ncbi:MAG: bifunctional aconitate hydratase 2/2-methylisocitrate dehydratase [Chitinispirillales bacterium]|jgi:aconitate hydratase 2/2-methylisocitrate dehydratase|nr:bifunctional aconitate hydratase 2/2-methylisocitrate dehydratase [Chitinispirillales bacterium]